VTWEGDTAARSVAQAFARSELCPSSVEQTALCAHWAERGTTVRARLLERLDAGLVAEATSSLAPAWSQAAQVHALGLGAAAYHYLAQPLGRSPARAREAEQAGALTQLVVAIYDHLLDEGVIETPVRPPVFGMALRGGHPQITDAPPAVLLVLALTGEWGRLVQVVGEADPVGVEWLLSLAEGMAAVEAATLTATRSSSAWVPEQRARLPFEAVGAIARLAQPGTKDGLATWHATWCGRVGAALGLLDDVVDLEADEAAGRVNMFAGSTELAPEDIVTDLEALHEEWRSRTDPAPEADHAQTLGMITRSWLAASMHEQTNRQLTEAPVR